MSGIIVLKKKIIRLLGRFSDVSRDGMTSVQTEVESADGIVTTQEYVVLDCGCHFDHSKVFVDRWSGKTVCENCSVVCEGCGERLWVGSAKKVGQSYLCPDHIVSGTLKLAFQALSRREK